LFHSRDALFETQASHVLAVEFFNFLEALGCAQDSLDHLLIFAPYP